LISEKILLCSGLGLLCDARHPFVFQGCDMISFPTSIDP
jgi:hypothetical protein